MQDDLAKGSFKSKADFSLIVVSGHRLTREYLISVREAFINEIGLWLYILYYNFSIQ